MERKGSVIEKQGFGSTGSSTNKEVQNTVDLKKFDEALAGQKLWFVDRVPFGLNFEILRLSAGDCRLDENRKPQPYFKCLSWRAGMRRR